MSVDEVTPAAIYITLVLCLGLGCCLHFLIIRFAKQNHPAENRVEGWPLPVTDFSFGMFVLISVALLTVSALGLVIRDFEDQMRQITAAAVSQLAVLVALLAFLKYFPEKFTPPINSRRLGWGATIKTALYSFFVAIPIIWTLSAAWTGLLHLFGISPPQQEPVLWFVEADGLSMILMMVAATVFIAPVTEEFLFRGCFYRFLKARTTLPVAMAVSGIFFALLHYSMLAVVPLFVLGVILAYAYEKTGNLKVPILIHAFWNANTVVILYLSNHLT
jgi:membrane protease YdiL (CAAX protease family)